MRTYPCGCGEGCDGRPVIQACDAILLCATCHGFVTDMRKFATAGGSLFDWLAAVQKVKPPCDTKYTSRASRPSSSTQREEWMTTIPSRSNSALLSRSAESRQKRSAAPSKQPSANSLSGSTSAERREIPAGAIKSAPEPSRQEAERRPARPRRRRGRIRRRSGIRQNARRDPRTSWPTTRRCSSRSTSRSARLAPCGRGRAVQRMGLHVRPRRRRRTSRGRAHHRMARHRRAASRSRRLATDVQWQLRQIRGRLRAAARIVIEHGKAGKLSGRVTARQGTAWQCPVVQGAVRRGIERGFRIALDHS